jgi:hypothetical protein
LASLENLVSAGNSVFLHGTGDGPNDHVPGANNPNMKALSLTTGMALGSWSTMNDFPTGDWEAAIAGGVIVNDDALTIVDTSTFMDNTAAAISGVCQIGDSDGEIVVDAANNRFYAFNRGQYHDLSQYPGYCIPPGNVSGYDLGSGNVLWSQNITNYPVTSTGHLSYAAGVLYFSVQYTPDGNGTPAGKAPFDGVYAFDATTGQQKWLQGPPSGTTYGAVSTDGSAAYVSAVVAGELKIVKLDVATGAPGWTSASLGSVSSLGQSFEADPAAYLGSSLLVYTGSSLIALDRSTGSTQWNVPGLTGSVSKNGNHLAISGGSGIVYLTDSAGIRAYKAADGSAVWNQDVTNVGTLGSLVLARGRAIVFGDAGLVVLTP